MGNERYPCMDQAVRTEGENFNFTSLLPQLLSFHLIVVLSMLTLQLQSPEQGEAPSRKASSIPAKPCWHTFILLVMAQCRYQSPGQNLAEAVVSTMA